MKTYHTQLAEWAKRRKRLLSMINNGKTQAQVAREFGVSRQAIFKLLAKAKGKC